jgi:hypothetical protein
MIPLASAVFAAAEILALGVFIWFFYHTSYFFHILFVRRGVL